MTITKRCSLAKEKVKDRVAKDLEVGDKDEDRTNFAAREKPLSRI